MRHIDTVVIHHSQTPPNLSNHDVLHMIDTAHARMAHPRPNIYGLHIAHHILIYTDGTYHKTRSYDEIGRHSYDTRIDATSISICFVGDFTTHSPSKKQYETACILIREIRSMGSHIHVVGHNTIAPVQCPGNGVDISYLSSASFPSYTPQKSSNTSQSSGSTHESPTHNSPTITHTSHIPTWVSMLHQRPQVYISHTPPNTTSGHIIWNFIIAFIIGVLCCILLDVYINALGMRLGGENTWHLPPGYYLSVFILSQLRARKRVAPLATK